MLNDFFRTLTNPPSNTYQPNKPRTKDQRPKEHKETKAPQAHEIKENCPTKPNQRNNPTT
jgi:hypothetical protein